MTTQHTRLLNLSANRDTGADSAETIRRYVEQPFGLFAELVRLQAAAHPDKTALVCGAGRASYRDLNEHADRIAAGLQRDGVGTGDVVAICSASSIAYVAVFLGTLRTGAAICPLSPSSTASQLLGMLRDSGATHVFTDAVGSEAFGAALAQVPARRVALDEGGQGESLVAWLPPEGARPAPVAITPEQPFNIIYSSGTTGTPKGIVQPHAMRWPQLHLIDPPGYGPDSVAILSTPLYSNTTLVSLLPALSGGGTVVLMPRFDARQFLELCERHRMTETMLVPVQYRRILDVSDFDRFDLSSTRTKFATSAPFAAELKAEVLARWPGGLVEYFGMTEGGGSCMLVAHEHPDKLHTVGQPIAGHEMLVIDAQGQPLPPGEAGEVVGRSQAMMNGYHNQPGKTADAEWYSPQGERYIRTGDIARMDADGFFTLIGRKKDMIISGGINIYPIDLENVLHQHPAVREASVVSAPSTQWGETPVGYVTLRAGQDVSPEELKAWANAQLGKMQRLSEVRVMEELPRSAIGKILKRDLQLLCDASGTDRDT